MGPLVSAVVVFHDEGVSAIAALDSMKDNVDTARAEGIFLEAVAVLDGATDQTRDLVHRRGQWLDSIEEVSSGDLGLARNAGARAAKGEFLAFLDGDDLWGERWIADACRSAMAMKEFAIWHPEYIYYFDDDGYNQHSVTTTPNPYCRAAYGVHVSSNSPGFDRRSLIFANRWTANALTRREVHLLFPYDEADAARGIGFEDWSWNIKTLNHGIPHLIVNSTVHAIRRRNSNLSMTMRASGALPIFESSGPSQ